MIYSLQTKGLQATNRNNPCPICQKTDGDCRLGDKDLVLCMTYPDKYSAGNHPDYRFIKPSTNPLWGVYAPRIEDDNDFNREKWEREKERQAAKEAERLRLIEINALSVADRDRDIRAILSQLTLTEEHRALLKERGLTNQQIESLGYRSVKKFQVIEGNIRFGVRAGRLLNKVQGEYIEGILIPVPDHLGNYTALRINNPNHKENGKPKYFPLLGSRLKNGEIPLAVYGPEKAQGVTGIAEGLEFKPAIASLRLGIPVIGGNGVNHASSPQQLKATLEALKTSQVVLYVDAGMLGNKTVLAAYGRTIKLVESWGYQVVIAWWGQFTKADGDIDEISDDRLAQIQYLDPQTFLDIASKEQWRQKVGEAQKKLNTLSYKPDILINQKYFPSLDELQKIKALPNHGILNLVGPKGSGKSTLTKEIKGYYRSQGYEIISITPRIALGREQAFKWDIEWLGDIGADNVSLDFIAENTRQLGLCFDSIHRIANRDFTEKTLIIFDESELGFNHLITSKTLKDRRSFILKTLENILKDCLNNEGLIILSDADLTDISVDYCQALCPDTSIFTVVNEAKPQSWDVDFYTNSQTGADVKSAIFDDIENGLKLIIPVDNQGEAEALDREISKRFPDKKVIRIDRTTTETEAGRKFVEQINLSIRNEKPDVLIHTGSMGTGCSIDGEHYDKKSGQKQYFEEIYHWFDKVYGLFFGVIEPSQCRQYLARFRKPVPRIIWAKESGFKDDSCKSFLPDVIKRNLFKNSEQTLNIMELAKELAGGEDADDLAVLNALNGMMNRETGTWDNPHIDLYCQVKARRNYGLSQLAVQLRQELIEEGHTVRDYVSERSNAISDMIKATKEAIKVEQAVAIANAPDIPLKQAQSINRKATTTEDERNQATKAFLSAEFPDIELTPDFIHDWVLRDRRRELNAVKLFFFTQNPEVAKQLDTQEWRQKLKQFSQGAVFLPDIKTYLPKVKLLNDLGLFDLIDLNNPEREYRGTDKDVMDFKERAYFMRHRIYTAFGLTVTKNTYPMALIEKLAKRIGIRFYSNKYKIKGETVRGYRIVTQELNDPSRKMILESLSRRYVETITVKDFEQGQNLPVGLNKKGSCATDNLNHDDMANHPHNNGTVPQVLPLWESVEDCRQSAFEVGSLVKAVGDTCVYQIVKLNGAIAHLVQPDFPDWPPEFTLEVDICKLQRARH